MSRSSAETLRTVRQWQSETDAILHAREPIGARLTLFSLAAMVAVLIGSTPFMKVDRVVTSTGGQVVPTEALSTFQALDPSIIKSVNVKEGQQVDKGQLLATLDPTFAQADVGQYRQQISALTAQIARDRAEQQKGSFVIPAGLAADEVPYFRVQKALFDQRAEQYKAQVRSFDEKVKSTQATIDKLQADSQRYQQREGITKQIEGMRDTLYKSGSSSYLNLLQANDARLEMQRTMEFDRNSLLEAQHQISSTQADREAFINQWFSDSSQDMVTAQTQLDQAMASLQKASKKKDLVQLTAAEPSVVLQLSKLSMGSVLKEGDELMQLVPLRVPMEAEIQISSSDVGFVRPGDPVTMKIDAFNYFEHGTAEGHLVWVSEGSFTTDTNNQPVQTPYYKARVQIDKLNFVDVPKNFRLIPGMTLTADINVGTRSVFRYIVGGFFRGMGEAMREP